MPPERRGARSLVHRRDRAYRQPSDQPDRRTPAVELAGRKSDPEPGASCLSNAFVVRLTINMDRSEEHKYELQSLMRTSYAVFCLKKKTKQNTSKQYTTKQ